MHTLGKTLVDWFAYNGRQHLPWRKPGITPYEVWVSEIMLQQTQVERVIPYYTRFLERFPTVEKLAQANWEEFLPYYQGLGYYRRGRNMLITAQIVVDQFGGAFPETEAELQQLPGVGAYTAKAILAFGYGRQKLAHDTNVQRVLGRVLHGNKKAVVDFPPTEKELETFLPDLNAAFMDFANAICLGKNPRCNECPLQRECVYFQTNGEREIVASITKSTFPIKSADVLLFLHENHQKYFSSKPDQYAPFHLTAPLNTRHRIQEYFRRMYNLELAVRPARAKMWKGEQPLLLMNAQILLGENTFTPFSPTDAKAYEELLTQSTNTDL